MARFCEGLEEREERALGAEERARAEAARRSWTWTAAARAVLVPGALLAVVPVALAAAVLPQRIATIVDVAATFLALFAAAPAALLWAGDALRARRALARDLRGGTALVFGAPPEELVVLPHSGRVLERGGVSQDLQARVVVGDAAPPPADAPTYGLPLPDADASGVLAHGWVRRALVPAERAELQRLAEILRRPPLRLAAMTGLFFLLGQPIVAGERDLAGAVLLAAGLVLLGGGWVRWARGRTLASRLLADAAEGWIVRATAGELAGTEVLPGSGAHWTQGGAPAAWRLRASRRR
jgi:hypothetical protein